MWKFREGDYVAVTAGMQEVPGDTRTYEMRGGSGMRSRVRTKGEFEKAGDAEQFRQSQAE